MAVRVALGFKLHTGWAAVVALAGDPGNCELLLRRRIELLPPGNSDARFVYHRAAELSAAQAQELVQQAKAASQETARGALKDMLDDLRSRGLAAAAAGIPSASKPAPEDLAAILGSHPMIHTAEGILFQRAVAFGCEACGVTVIPVREREAWRDAASAWGMTETVLHKQVDGLRKSVGAPWGADQKTAAVMALLALRSSSTNGPHPATRKRGNPR